MSKDPQRNIRLWITAKLNEAGRGAKGRLAEHMNVRPDAITRMLNTRPGKETRQISAHEIWLIEEFFGEKMDDDRGATVEVPVVAWVSAGELRREDIQDEIIGRETIAALPPGDWIALRVEGDSMDRISPPESVIILNRNDTALVANACYVIADPEGNATYKRFRPNPMRFEPVSTNPACEPIFPDHEPEIVGRVRLTLLRM